MATNEKVIELSNRVKSIKSSSNPETNHIIAGADDIFDDDKRKKQSVINRETDATLADHSSAINGLNSQNYVSVTATDQTTAATDVLPDTGAVDTIYRVGKWDGTQFDETCYSEYAWNGEDYMHLSTKTQIGEVFDISAYHATGGELAKYADLTAAFDSNNGGGVPQSLQKAGMRIQFVRTYDNKYVQYRLMADEWSINTEDWAIAEEGVYVENPEFIYVKTNTEDKILWAIKKDGGIYYGAGVPQQVIDYINDKIAELSLDEYEDIVDFLNGLEEGDKTLSQLLDEKVDKEEGKSLIDEQYANGVHYIENPEFTEVKIDAEKRILEAILKDSTKFLPAGVKVIGTAEYDGATIKTVENPEFAGVWLDKDKHILFGVQTDGNFLFGCGVPRQVKKYIEQKIEELSLDEYESIVAFIGDYLNNTTLEELLSKKVDGEYVENPEYIEAKVDAEGKILEATEKDGTKVFGGNLRVLGNMKVSGVSYKVIGNTEYLAAWVDAKDKIIFGFKTDGKTFVGDADFLNSIKQLQNQVDFLHNIFSCVENPEYISVDTDSENKVLGGRKVDGIRFETVGFESPKVNIDGNTIKTINDPEERIEVKTDKEEKIISYRDKAGTLHENVGFESPNITTNSLNLTEDGMNEFQQDLKESGFTPGGKTDWSNATHVEISKPRCAIINLHTEFNLSNLSKSDRPDAQKGVNYDIPVEVEFWDMQGNYFKKWSELSAQGNSSFNYPKKAFAFKFYNEDPGAQGFNKKNKFLIKFGNWVVQNGYHCKAYYTDPYRGLAVIAYQLYDDMLATRAANKNRVWKKALLPQQINDYSIGTTEDNVTELNLRYDTGARNFPDGFPVIAYQTHHVNGELVTEFYGIMSWQLKKDAANYMMDEESNTAIHIDTGDMRETGENGWWQAENPNWGTFEIRVPEKLICMDGSDYNGDFPAELIDSTSPYYDDNNKKHKKSAQVKAKIEAMRTYDDAVDALISGGATTEEIRAAFEEHFDMEETIDYAVHALVTANFDGFFRNRQWTTYDGVKWQVNPYDVDCVFGELPNGAQVTPASYSGSDSGYQMSYRIQSSPFRHLYDYYLDDIKTRYAQLRNVGVFTTKNIIDKLFTWINAIGYDNYKKEFERWPNCPCNKETVLNDGWELADNPFGGASNTYDPNTEYHEGDEVVIAYLRFKATRTIQGVYPTQSVGHKESIYRVEVWLNNRFALLDAWLEYSNN